MVTTNRSGVGSHGSRGGAAMALELGLPFLGSIPLDPSLSRASEAGKALALDRGGHVSPAAAALENVVANLHKQLALLDVHSGTTWSLQNVIAGSHTDSDGT